MIFFANAFSVFDFQKLLILGRCPRLEFMNAFGVLILRFL